MTEMTDEDVLKIAREHGYDTVAFAEAIREQERQRIANQIDRMPFGDTAASFAVWIRAGAP